MLFENRVTVDLNGKWKFNPDPYQRCRQQKWWLGEGNETFFPCYNMEGLWDIDVPGTWKKQFAELKWYDGHANYVRDFELAEIPEDMEAFLCFDGIVYSGEIYLNGQEVGKHEWGYSPFNYRVTDMLGKRNRLFVLVDNELSEERVPGIRFDWNNDGGIIGEVHLVFVPKVHLKNFRTFTELSDDEVHIGVDIFLESRDASVEELVEVRIPEIDLATTVAVKTGKKETVRLTIPFADIELWSPENPKLYRTELRTRHECIADDIGYREIKTCGRNILLNGEPIRLYGVAVHSEFPETGRTATDDGISLILEKARLLGANFLRCAHYPYARKFAKAMDRAGMLWWEEVPVYWLPKVHLDPQRSLALGMLRETIVRDWNRASLIFWSVSNECAGDNAGFCRSLQEGNYPYWVEATKLVRSLDPSRLVSSADSGHRRTLHSHWTPADADQFDGTDIDDDQWIPGHPEGFYSLLDVLGSNLYVQKPGQNPEATRRFVEMLADYNKPLLITEFGSMSVSGQLPDGHRPDELGGPEYHAAILREAYQALHEFPEIVGCTPWVLMDVRVPMHWRWYNQGSGCFAYGLLDNQYHEKPVFSVVKNEIQRLRERFDESSLNVPIQQKHH